ncbi:MAG: hypothetical protein KAU46_01655 [Candidatus Aminicenantes bacterium]|nr:hypothetical protein [Candidatus Aminicenantes bacterium]
MKDKKAMVIMFLISFAFGIWGYSTFLTANQESIKMEEMEKYLKTATISPDWISVGARTEAYFVNLDDGKIKKGGFLKFTNRTRPHNLPDSYKYAIAAYELDKLLDLNLVPPIVEREIDDRKASLQILIKNTLGEDVRQVKKIEAPDHKSFSNTLKDVNVFDNLTYSSSLCQHNGQLSDILIEHKKDWKVWRIDLSQAFGPYSELILDCKITRCSRKLYQNLLKLDDKIISSKLKKYINKAEMKALLKRKKIIIDTIKQLIKEKGEEAVLFS